ncbi:MAG: hypothetical protein HC831_30820 [Chloroflexia bacterium]|nr:hypothetical protein [Chloroflexia bacterium]
MNELAEIGFAAHWKYKGVEDKESELDIWIKKLKKSLEMLDNQTQVFL